MPFNQHGMFKLGWRGRCMVVTAEGAWNEVAVQALAQAAALAWGRVAGERWGVLVDARTWESVTPEGVRLWQTRFEDEAVKAGAVALAAVLPSNFHRAMMREASRRLEGLCAHHMGLDLEAAWQWMRAQGVRLDGGET